MMKDVNLVKWFEEVGNGDTESVGGKGASLGEMYCALRSSGVRVPNGFNVTTSAYTSSSTQKSQILHGTM